ncbi:hypothetical protein V5G20_17840 [Brevibacillus borstelensis]|uniref:hypothetical protein n=1 Tax=Brevibacillus borstelensis TaxID=45462 RepID=UPI0030D54785
MKYFAVLYKGTIIDIVTEDDSVEQLSVTYDNKTWFDTVEVTESTALEIAGILRLEVTANE